ncbi:MAG: DUF58 domain-containing protein [Chloroflexi bacterium]|nr:DUF58 domain-containing protein [Chloroflexota bacterium]MCI0580081.1 DUF58 domain-containing protein [Chloroflexota bacterium]MCI0649343.1 DUF58 domain-containing protein [Chloroflexota bacterium]
MRGVLLLLLAAPLLAAATWAPALQWLAGLYALLVVGLLLLDWRLAGPVRRFDLERQHDTKLSLGANNPIHLLLRNRSRRPATFWLRDEPPDAFEMDTRLLSGAAGPHSAWQGVYHVRPLRRGDYRFGNLNLRWRGPLGLAVRQGTVAAAGPVKVYPNLLNVRRYDLLLRRNRLQELGLRHTRQFGEGTEFERLREYLPDDEFRRIDWKATARRHRPVTVEYQTERSQNVVAVVDTGRMMQSPVERIAKLDYVINAVLFLAYVATGKGDKIGLMTFADDVGHFLAPRQGRGQFYRMLEMLYAVEAEPVEPNYQRALAYLALKQRKRALVVIFTDLSGGVSMSALVSHASVLARRSLPLVVTISDPDIVATARQQPRDSLAVYQRAAAAQLLDERQLALDTLHRQGVLTLDVPANQLSIAVINRYLELKGKTML